MFVFFIPLVVLVLHFIINGFCCSPARGHMKQLAALLGEGRVANINRFIIRPAASQLARGCQQSKEQADLFGDFRVGLFIEPK